MSKRTVPSLADMDTQSQIINIAMKLFALRGFKAVTLKDIAKEVGIRIASLYYYYDSKDALIADVLTHFEKAHAGVMQQIRNWSDETESADDFLGNLLSEDFLQSLDTTARLGMSMALKEQHNTESATRTVLNSFHHQNIEIVQNGFDRLIEKGVIPPSDTKTLASLYMCCIMALNDIHLYELAETETPIDRNKIYSGLKTIMAAALIQGMLETD